MSDIFKKPMFEETMLEDRDSVSLIRRVAIGLGSSAAIGCAALGGLAAPNVAEDLLDKVLTVEYGDMMGANGTWADQAAIELRGGGRILEDEMGDNTPVGVKFPGDMGAIEAISWAPTHGPVPN